MMGEKRSDGERRRNGRGEKKKTEEVGGKTGKARLRSQGNGGNPGRGERREAGE